MKQTIHCTLNCADSTYTVFPNQDVRDAALVDGTLTPIDLTLSTGDYDLYYTDITGGHMGRVKELTLRKVK